MTLKPYGIQYKPGTPKGPAISVSDLDSLGVRYVRVTWVDLINNIRYRVLPLSYFKTLLNSDRPGITLLKAALGIVALSLADGFVPVDEYLLVPDLNTLSLCPYAEGHATVFGWIQEKKPSPTGSLEAALCPRTLLKRVVEDASAAGYSLLIGVETEFTLLKSVNPVITPVSTHDWSVASATFTGSLASKILEEIADDLQKAGVELQMYHAEAGPGQFEIITGPMDPLEAADALVFTRETIYNVANKYGCRATLAPRLYDTSCGSAAHHHVSIHSNKKQQDASQSEIAPTLAKFERSFLQSLLDNVPALTCLTLPTAASYGRVMDGIWSGGTQVCWGNDNKEVPIRLTGSPGNHNFELKFIDGTSNPYLVMAGIVGAGMVGVKREQELTMKACDTMPSGLSNQEKKNLGITTKLPRTITEARDALSNCWELKVAFGEEFVEKYLAVNRKLEEVLKMNDAEEETKRLIGYY